MEGTCDKCRTEGKLRTLGMNKHLCKKCFENAVKWNLRKMWAQENAGVMAVIVGVATLILVAMQFFK